LSAVFYSLKDEKKSKNYLTTESANDVGVSEDMKASEADSTSESTTVYEKFYEEVEKLAVKRTSDYRVAKVTRTTEIDQLMKWFLIFINRLERKQLDIPLDAINGVSLREDAIQSNDTRNKALIRLELNASELLSAFPNSSDRPENLTGESDCALLLYGGKAAVSKCVYQVCESNPMLESDLLQQNLSSSFTNIRDEQGETSDDESSDLGSDDSWTPYGLDDNHENGYNVSSDHDQYLSEPLSEVDSRQLISDDDEELNSLIQSLLSLQADEGDMSLETEHDAHGHSHAHSHSHGESCAHNEDDEASLTESYLEEILDVDFGDFDINNFHWEEQPSTK